MVKRVNYFDNQFLRAADFNDEQSYHIGMRRSHNMLMHTYGVADGLIPSKTPDDPECIVISKGFGVDSNGNEIQLDNAVTSLSLKAYRGTTRFITIAWTEADADASTELGGAGVTRKELKPVLDFPTTAPADGKKLVLGTVTVNAEGRVESVDPNASRIMAGARGGNLSAVGLTLTGLNIDPAQQPKMSVRTLGQVDLKGSLTIDGSLMVAKNGAFAGDLTVIGKVGIGTSAPVSALHVAGKSATLRIHENGELFDDGNFHIHARSGQFWINALDNSPVQINAQTAGNVILTNGTGQVGIGTVGPASQLHVHQGDDTEWSGRGVFSGQTNAAVIGTYNGKAVVGAHVAALNKWSALLINDDGSGGGDVVTGMGTNKVGIGTASPGEKLDVVGTVRATGAVNYQNGFTARSAAGGIATLRIAPASAYAGIDTELGFTGTDTNIPFVIRTNEKPVATFLTNGNVGIGVTNPSYALDVQNGGVVRVHQSDAASGAHFLTTTSTAGQTVHVVSYGASQAGTSFGTNYAGTNSVWAAGGAGALFKIGTTDAAALVLGTSNAERVRIDPAGNVGIGMTPGFKLDVAGNARFFGNLQLEIGDVSPISVRTSFFSDNSGWQYRIAKNVGGTKADLFTIVDNGNVGIGTMNPGQRLHVNGNIAGTGRLMSPMFQVTQVFNNRQGGLPLSGNFSTGGGTLMFFFTGSGWNGGNVTMGADVSIAGRGVILSCRRWANEGSSHKAFGGSSVYRDLPAGTYTVTVTAVALSTDLNDYFSLTILELPF